jgi:hypothetical protein
LTVLFCGTRVRLPTSGSASYRPHTSPHRYSLLT